MDTEILVGPQLDEGQLLIDQLGREGFRVSVAFWAKTSDEGSWRLYIASHSTNEQNLGEAYHKVYSTLNQTPEISITPLDINLISDLSPIAQGAIILRDRHPINEPYNYRGKKIGDLSIKESWIYPFKDSARLSVKVSYYREGSANQWRAETKIGKLDLTTRARGAIGCSTDYWVNKNESDVDFANVPVLLEIDPKLDEQSIQRDSLLQQTIIEQANELADRVFKSKHHNAEIIHKSSQRSLFFDPFANLPHSLDSPIPVEDPNSPVSLYNGFVDVEFEGQIFKAQTAIYLEWLPFPRIRFDMPNIPQSIRRFGKKLTLVLSDGTRIENARLLSSTLFSQAGVYPGWGHIRDDKVTRLKSDNAKYVLFLVPNLVGYLGEAIRIADTEARAGRLILDGSGWTITLDTVQTDKNESYLKESSGFAFTHTGKLQRKDGTVVTIADAQSVLEAFASYLSFASGRWTGPFFPHGYDSNNELVWSRWTWSRTAPYKYRASWADSHDPQTFGGAFHGFLKIWQEKVHQEQIHLAIHWYVEANASAGSIEGSIVLIQIALETLASVLHEKLNLSDQLDRPIDLIQSLFQWVGIPREIPHQLTGLSSAAASFGTFDAATVITTMRDIIAHPTSENQSQLNNFPLSTKHEVWTLGLWALELCLLRVFEYEGHYVNRISAEWAGRTELAPWVKEIGT